MHFATLASMQANLWARRLGVGIAGVLPLALMVGTWHLSCPRALPNRDPQGTVGKLDRVHAVLLNGGGTKEQNYRSHVLHLQHFARLLRAAGVPEENIVIFNGDGEDPEPDVAVRTSARHRHGWLAQGTPLRAWLDKGIEYQNMRVAPWRSRAATAQEVEAWFAEAKDRLGPEDVLVVFVTDHGLKNPQDADDNSIVLWGKNAKLSVSQWNALLRQFDSGVRVVSLMSQCFSGAFARSMYVRTDGLHPSGNTCGYFASTRDRPAYGCYAENLGKNNVGYAFHMLRAWAAERSLQRAHEVVLVADDTPDVPLRTSDQYLEDLLRATSTQQQIEFPHFVDQLLVEAWQEKAKWESHVRLLDDIGRAYGMFSPRSMAELETQIKSLSETAEQLRNVSHSWQGAWHDANSANWQRFLDANPHWREQLSKLEPNSLADLERRNLAAELLPELRAFTIQQPAAFKRLLRLRHNAVEAQAASYRLEVRLAALLRMQRLLVQVAGIQYLYTRGSDEQRRAYQALRQCEEMELTPQNLPAPGVRKLKAFPRYDDDVTKARAALPSWMGIQFRTPSEELVRRYNLRPGAAAVTGVYPGSPAAAAGLQQGDIVIGPPGQPFEERGQVRSWVMMARQGEPLLLEILREGQQHTLTVIPGPYPLRWPSLPAPPKPDSPAPPLELIPYRGEIPRHFGSGQPYLLFFWATWCAACKASLGEILAFEAQRQVPVLAITDEPRQQLDRFFANFAGPFPERVAIDEFRKAFVAYGVSGTPTFVLVDAAGAVRAVHTGYDAQSGQPFKDWEWKQ